MYVIVGPGRRYFVTAKGKGDSDLGQAKVFETRAEAEVHAIEFDVILTMDEARAIEAAREI
jgi:hypothetical protein